MTRSWHTRKTQIVVGWGDIALYAQVQYMRLHSPSNPQAGAHPQTPGGGGGVLCDQHVIYLKE